jgi:hypothetical protein
VGPYDFVRPPKEAVIRLLIPETVPCAREVNKAFCRTTLLAAALVAITAPTLDATSPSPMKIQPLLMEPAILPPEERITKKKVLPLMVASTVVDSPES